MNFEQGLAQQIDTVFSSNPEIRDHRKEHPWLTGSLGDPHSGIFFLAENPSLSMVERATNPEGGPLSPEAQWYASKGDRLFREALVEARFKDPQWNSIGGWHCYITNVIKEADYAEKWKKKTMEARRDAAKAWAPVLRWQLEQSAPRLVVLMGGKVEKHIQHLEKLDLISLPQTRKIHHYSYIGLRPQGKLGPMHPERVKAYRNEMLNIRERFGQM